MKFSDVLKKISLILVPVILTLVLLEMVIRVFNLAPEVIAISYYRTVDNPKIVYELIPGACVDNSFLNKQGFKDSDFVKDKPRNLVRIAMLGDSITQGVGVRLGETFSDVLEELLNLRAGQIKSNVRYEVMNFGVIGYNLEAEVEILRTKVLAYSPDIVVLNLFHNDNEPLPGLDAFLGSDSILGDKQKLFFLKKYYTNRNSFVCFLKKKMLYKSHLYLFLLDRMAAFSCDNQALSAFTERYHDSIMDKEDQVFISRQLKIIEQLKQSFGFKFLVCIHSHLLYGENPNNSKFAELIDQYHFPYFRMFEYYKKEVTSSDAIKLPPQKDSCHPNEFGHSIIAKAIFNELKKYKYIDERL